MKKIKHVFLCLVLLFLISNCKSQIITDREIGIIEPIQDSIICNGKSLKHYNLPYFSFKSKKSSHVLNKVIKENVESFIFVDEEEVIDSISLKKTITNFTQFASTNCCFIKCYSFNKCDYSIKFLNKYIVSFQLNIETYTAYPTSHSFVYNFDIENGKMIYTDFIKTNDKLINQIQNELNNQYPNEFIVDEIPEIWYIAKNESGQNGITFMNGFGSGYGITPENLDSLYEVFIPFQKLKPYLTEDFKQKVGI